MKGIKVIKKVLLGIIGTIFFVFAVIMSVFLLNRNRFGVTEINNTSYLIIKEKIASDNYQKGDLVLIERKKLANINPGDEIFIYQVDSTGIISVDVGIIGETDFEAETVSFESGATYDIEFVIGEASKVYKNVGTYLSIILSTWGFLFIVVVPCFLIFIHQVYVLIIEIRYGKKEAAKVGTPA
jgi:hypothetical protein